METEKERERGLYGVVLGVLMRVRDVKPQDLAVLAEMGAKLISNYQSCLKPLKRARLDLLAAAMGYVPEEVDDAISWVRAKRTGLAARRGVVESAGGHWQPADQTIEHLGQAVQRFARQIFDVILREGSAVVARQQAQQLWAKLRRYNPEERRLLAEQRVDLRNWALCELLCQESLDVTGDDAAAALNLARLALTIAERVPGDEALRQEVQGYAWAHVGNATRVGGDLNGADRAFTRFRQLWPPGDGPKSGLFSEALVLGLEASLRRDQRQCSLALDLLDQAMALGPGRWAPHLLNNKARVFIELGEYEEAIQYLTEADAALPPGEEPRLRWGLKWNLASCLCHLERFGEASDMLPQIWACAPNLQGVLDVARLRWVEGRVAAGLGKSEEALRTLREARETFLSRTIAYDAALVTLEIAALLLEVGRTAEVKGLVREMTPIFRCEGVHREALGAIRLFCEAVRREKATVTLARRVITFLYRAQYNPDLAFEE